MNTLHQHIVEIRARLVAGESTYSVAKRFKLQPVELINLTRTDPDIVAAREAAKAAGTMRAPTRKLKPDHYSSMPWVIDVVEGGLTQVQAAAKYGKPQSYISKCVSSARKEMQPATPTPPTTSSAPNNDDAKLIADLITSLAAKAGIPAKTLLESVAAIL